MPSFLSKIKSFATPSLNSRNSKSANDLSYTSQGYLVKEKDLSKLQLAAWKGDMDKIVEYCKPGKLDACDKEGRTPLHLAAAANHRNVVEYLLDQGAKINTFDKEKRSPLTLAALNGNPEILTTLVNYNKAKVKTIVNEDDIKGLNALHYAIRSDRAIGLLHILFSIETLEINHEDKDRNTALHIATIRENAEAVRMLIDNNAELDARNCDGRTPLILASMKGATHIMRLLIENQCEKNIRDNENKTAEDYCKSKPECADLIRGKTRLSKSFNMADNNAKLGQSSQVRSPSLNNNETTISEVTKSKTDKFDKLFAGSAGGTASNVRDRDEDNDDNESNTSQILDEKQEPVTIKSEKISSWNDSDLSLVEQNKEASKNKEKEKNVAGVEAYDSLFQSAKEDETDKTSMAISKPQATAQKQQIRKQDSQLSDENSWLDDSSTYDQKHRPKKNPDEKSFSFIAIPETKAKEPDSDYSKNDCTWFIYVYTSNLSNAGTDARVRIKVYGTKANSDDIWLENEKNNKKLFEKGSLDQFAKVLPDIGKPQKIRIGHDNSGPFPGWHLEKVILNHSRTQEKYNFIVNRWLAKNEGDGKTEVEINVEDKSKTVKREEPKSMNSWNSSGDEDSSLSLIAKPTNSKAKTLNQINEELNETFGSKKSSGNNTSIDEKKQQQQQQVIKFSNKNDNNNNNNMSTNDEAESSVLSMNDLSAVEKLVNSLIKKPDLNTKVKPVENKLLKHESSTDSMDLVEQFLNDMDLTNDLDHNNSKNNKFDNNGQNKANNNYNNNTNNNAEKLSLASLNSNSFEQLHNKTGSTLTHITAVVNTPLNNTSFSSYVERQQKSYGQNNNNISISGLNNTIGSYNDSKNLSSSHHNSDSNLIKFTNDPDDSYINKLIGASTLPAGASSSSKIIVVPYSSLSGDELDNDPFQTSANTFVQLTGTGSANTSANVAPPQVTIKPVVATATNDDFDVIDADIDEIKLDPSNSFPLSSSKTNSNQSRIINFASLSKHKKGNLDQNTSTVDTNHSFKSNAKPNLNDNTSDKMNIRETSWANQKSMQRPPEISDPEDNSEDDVHNVSFGATTSPMYHKGPLSTFSRGDSGKNQIGRFNSEREVDNNDENKEEQANNYGISNLAKAFSPKHDAFAHKEDLVDLEDDYENYEQSSNATDSKNNEKAMKSIKYPTVSALVKPIIPNKSHHGIPTADDNNSDKHSETDPYEDIHSVGFAAGTGLFSAIGSLKAPISPNDNYFQEFEDEAEIYENIEANPANPTISSLAKVFANVKKENLFDPNENASKNNNNSNEKNNTINGLVLKPSLKKQDTDDNSGSNSNSSSSNSNSDGPGLQGLIGNLIASNQKPANKNENQNNNSSQNQSPSQKPSINNNNNNSLESLIMAMSPDKKKWTNFNELDNKKATQQNTTPSVASPNKTNNETKPNNYSVLNAAVIQAKIPSIDSKDTVDSKEPTSQTSTNMNDTKNSTIGALVKGLMSPSKTTNTTNQVVQKDSSSNNTTADNSTFTSPTNQKANSKVKEIANIFQPNQTTWSQANKKLESSSKQPSIDNQTASSTSAPNAGSSIYSVLGNLANQNVIINPNMKFNEAGNDKNEKLANESPKYSAIGNLVNQNMKNTLNKIDDSANPNAKPIDNKANTPGLNDLIQQTIAQNRKDSTNTSPSKVINKSPGLNELIAQNINKASDNNFVVNLIDDNDIENDVDEEEEEVNHEEIEDDEDEQREEYLRKKRAEDEKKLELAKKKQKDHRGSLSSDFDEGDVDDAVHGIDIEPPIGFSKNANVNTNQPSSSSGGSVFGFSSTANTGTAVLLNALNNNKNLITYPEANAAIDYVEFSTSESDFYMNNENYSSEINNLKKQFDLNTNSNNTVISQQLKFKQNEVMHLKQLLDETIKQKKNLENELKTIQDKKKDLEAVLTKTQDLLVEKEQTQLDVDNKNNKSEIALKSNAHEIKKLNSEIVDLKSEKQNLETRLALLQANPKTFDSPLVQQLNEQNERLSVEIKALKHQIDELNKDRNLLSEHKEELSARLDESEMSVNKHQEALEKAILQFNLEKAVIRDENVKLKSDMQEAIRMKTHLNEEIQRIKIEIKENKLEIEKLVREKQEIERSLDKEKHEKERLKNKYDTDINAYKEQQLQLIEKLGFTEAKLISVEKEYKHCKTTIQEKQMQLDEHKNELIRLKNDLSVQESLLNKEKEEKIKLSAKNESIQERLRLMQDENLNLKKQQQEIIDTHKYEKLHSASLKELERKKMDSDKEVNLLKQDLNILNQKLFNAELELKTQKHVKSSDMQQDNSDEYTKVNVKQNQTKPTQNENKDVYLEESRKLKAELDQLRSEFHLLLTKYEIPESDNYPTREADIRPQDLIYSRARNNRVDVPGLITHMPLRNKYDSSYMPVAAYQQIEKQYDHSHNHTNHSNYDPNRTTIIVPNGDIILPSSNGFDGSASLPVKLTSSGSYHKNYHSNKVPCDRCASETQNYIDLIRTEIAKTVEVQTAKELPLANLTYKSSVRSINNTNFNDSLPNNLNKTDNYDTLRNSILENSRYSMSNYDLVNSLRSKYFI